MPASKLIQPIRLITTLLSGDGHRVKLFLTPEGGVSLDAYPNIRAWLRRVDALPRFIAMPSTKAGLLAA